MLFTIHAIHFTIHVIFTINLSVKVYYLIHSEHSVPTYRFFFFPLEGSTLARNCNTEIQGTFGMIQGTFGMIQGTVGMIQGTLIWCTS
jgi:hypothetical protein